MGLKAEYHHCRDGGWNLWVRPEGWSQGLWREVLRELDTEADRPQLRRFYYPPGKNGAELYLKIYERSPAAGILKDFFRDSRALRSLKQGEALCRLGFNAPVALAAGERRKFGLLQRAFLLTRAVEGMPLYLFLARNYSLPLDRDAVREKRQYVKQLACEIRLFHELGFVHGDLTHSNIVVRREGGAATFFLMDNDRTRRYPAWFPQLLWRNNLVQLNRFSLAGISLQDRLRFLHSYIGREKWNKGDRRLIRWLEEKTRDRLREFGELEEGASFRRLVRWKGSLS